MKEKKFGKNNLWKVNLGLLIISIILMILTLIFDIEFKNIINYLVIIMSIIIIIIGIILDKDKIKSKFSKGCIVVAVIIFIISITSISSYEEVEDIDEEDEIEENIEKETEEESDENKTFKSVSVKSYDKNTNGTIVYGSAESNDITNTDSINATLGSCDGKYSYSLNVENSKLFFTDKSNNKKSQITSLGSVKNILKMITGDCSTQIIGILTSSGKVYLYSYNGEGSINVQNISSKLVEVKTNFVVQKIGYKSDCIGCIAILSTDGNKYTVSMIGEIEKFETYYDSFSVPVAPLATMQINFDASITFDDKYLKDNNGNKIYLQYAFEDADDSKIYIIDRQAYLHVLTANTMDYSFGIASNYNTKVKSFDIEDNYNPTDISQYGNITLKLNFENNKTKKYTIYNYSTFGL